MRKLLVSVLLAISIAGCVSLPSFWDDNQSHVATNIRFSVSKIDCDNYHPLMAIRVRDYVEWFIMYSESKGTPDVQEIAVKMKSTIDPMVKKSTDVSPAYCKVKKQVLEQQSKMFARSVLRRY